MANKYASANPLVITGKAPDTSLSVQLHPLVLLIISEYITRHTLRKQSGPIVGAILGQQNGRNFTLEQAFHCVVAKDTSEVLLDGEWFTQRLEMYKEVHKEPALDLVGLFAIGTVEGPQPAHLPLLQQVQDLTSTDTVMLLLFHPEQVNTLQGGKLPISLYEKVEELEGEQTQTRFRELDFEVETGDAERIGIDFVAKGGGNATAVPKAETSASSSKDKKGKGRLTRAKDDESDANNATSSTGLSPEEEELVSALNAKANAIKMLSERIALIRDYLASLPDSYLTDASSTAAAPDGTNFTLLRSINAMISRLSLLAPPVPATQSPTSAEGTLPPSNLELAAEKEKQDVHLTSLLAGLTRSIAEAQSMRSKFAIVHREKVNRERAAFNRGGAGRFGGLTGPDEGVLADAGGI